MTKGYIIYTTRKLIFLAFIVLIVLFISSYANDTSNDSDTGIELVERAKEIEEERNKELRLESETLLRQYGEGLLKYQEDPIRDEMYQAYNERLSSILNSTGKEKLLVNSEKGTLLAIRIWIFQSIFMKK